MATTPKEEKAHKDVECFRYDGHVTIDLKTGKRRQHMYIHSTKNSAFCEFVKANFADTVRYVIADIGSPAFAVWIEKMMALYTAWKVLAK